MLETVTNVSSNGLREWLIQRVSAVVLAAYAFFLLAYFIGHPQLEFAQWQMLFANNGMRIFSFLALLSLVLHAWIGIWVVFTDYVKIIGLRLILQILVVLGLFAYLAWGISVIWGVPGV